MEQYRVGERQWRNREVNRGDGVSGGCSSPHGPRQKNGLDLDFDATFAHVNH